MPDHLTRVDVLHADQIQPPFCGRHVDGRTGKLDRAARQELWATAHQRTVAVWFQEKGGKVTVIVDPGATVCVLEGYLEGSGTVFNKEEHMTPMLMSVAEPEFLPWIVESEEEAQDLVRRLMAVLRRTVDAAPILGAV